MIHELKSECQSFAAVETGRKSAEFRRDDRPFAADDLLILREWSADGRCYSGPALAVKVAHVARSRHIPEGYVMLSLCRERLRFCMPIATPPYRG